MASVLGCSTSRAHLTSAPAGQGCRAGRAGWSSSRGGLEPASRRVLNPRGSGAAWLAPRAIDPTMPEFIFTMTGVTRVHPPDKRVLENIHLAFYPGAKIGVLGINGSGKSSLLRIMAGVDKEFIGEAKPHPGTKIGYFAQEPDLGNAKTVW